MKTKTNAKIKIKKPTHYPPVPSISKYIPWSSTHNEYLLATLKHSSTPKNSLETPEKTHEENLQTGIWTSCFQLRELTLRHTPPCSLKQKISTWRIEIEIWLYGWYWSEDSLVWRICPCPWKKCPNRWKFKLIFIYRAPLMSLLITKYVFIYLDSV